MSENGAKMTVARYLKARLEELGLEQLFCVAGNYTAPFLDTILEDRVSPIAITGIPNEICAGYAADGHARLKGISAVAVTYGVGACSLLNAVAGSTVELAPVVVINGAPTNKEFQNAISAGLLYSHMTYDPYSNLDVYRRITVNAERLINAGEAPSQIDAVLTACVTHRRPVYLEVLEDVWRAECPAPVGKLSTKQSSITVSDVPDAIKATLAMMDKKGKPLFWAGVEIQRLGLQCEFLKLVDESGYYFTTSLLGKSIVSEDHAHFLGVFSPSAPQQMKDLIGGAGCLIGLGAWTTGKDVGNQLILSDSVALASHGGMSVGPLFFPNVQLRDYLPALTDAIIKRKKAKKLAAAYAPGRPEFLRVLLKAAAPSKLTYDDFFSTLNGWLKKEHVVVCDAGYPLIGAQNLRIHEANGFVAQAAWLSIGYSTAAAIGVKFALPERRPIVIVGDGAFQETCQAVSSHHYLKQATVVFVLANGIYGIEQKLVNPNPFRSQPVKYPDKIYNSVFAYNRLHGWAYEKLTDAFGGKPVRVTNTAELNEALRLIDASPDDNFVVHVEVPELATPKAIHEHLDGVGEDEIENPKWPPALLF